jgi:DNA repair exonuclease SbcCD ATPase subunit
VKITALESQNVKRLSAVAINPDGSLIAIGGANAAGKSSVLDSIAYALGGKSLIPGEPLRQGQKKGHVTIELDGDTKRSLPPLTVTRTFTASGTTSLKVTAADGVPTDSPQKLLDSLCGKIAFDPLDFTRMAPAKQAETLRGLVGLDFSEHDAQRKSTFDERTAVNRDAKAAKTRLDAAPKHDDAPAVPVVVADLMAELEAAQATNRAREGAYAGAQRVEDSVGALAGNARNIVVRIEDLTRQLAEANEELKELSATRLQAEQRAAKSRAAAEAMPEVECDLLHERIRNAEAINAKVRANQAHKRLTDEAATLCDKSDTLTEALDDLAGLKQRELEAAQWPVDGLGFSDDGITYSGLPFDQASSAEQLRVAVAIGLALNPTLRVLLIRDGSLLDGENLQAVADMADAADAQVWVERVGEGDECAGIIEDGHVKETS